MATKTIISTRTLHVPGKAFSPFKFSDRGIATEGKYDIAAAKPGTPVELDEADADALIAQGLAEPWVAAAAPEKVTAKKKGTGPGAD